MLRLEDMVKVPILIMVAGTWLVGTHLHIVKSLQDPVVRRSSWRSQTSPLIRVVAAMISA
jgi:hypothetical protein